MKAMTNNSQSMSQSHAHTLKRSERRESAVDAFIDLVLESGNAPSPDEVAKRAGVSIASMYRYFETLDELRNEPLLALRSVSPS